MPQDFDPAQNYEKARQRIGYVSRKEAGPEVYERLGFKSGLEIHQQLDTEKKLFCRCPAGVFHGPEEYDAEIIRHMRPTLSELGEYDGTALMEFKTKKNIVYHINNQTACTYEIDDTPPFQLNREALSSAMRVALLLKMSIVGELHITRKQYLDGSIPTGFQRTTIVGIEGEIPLPTKKIGIIQLGLEEESCREVSDVGHERVYTTDRLGMPLIEIVTYPDMKTPGEAAEAGQYLRFLTRSTGMMRTGVGAARQDTNVSIEGGTRVEIKGVAHIKWIPELTHNEAFRQKALLEIRSILNDRFKDASKWKMESKEIPYDFFHREIDFIEQLKEQDFRLVAVNLPGFKSLLSFFTQPGRVFADEIDDRLKVIACIEKPNMTHSEALDPLLSENEWLAIQKVFDHGTDNAQILLWGSEADIATAVETVEERCRLAFEGVPNETRKSLPDGTTLFERVLPGPDRMYPDTDSAPIPVKDAAIEKARENLPVEVSERVERLKAWGIPEDTFTYILRRNIFPVVEQIIDSSDVPPKFVGTLMGHHLRHLEGQRGLKAGYDYSRLVDLFGFVIQKKLALDILKPLLDAVYENGKISFEDALKSIGYRKNPKEKILSEIPNLKKKFQEIGLVDDRDAEAAWIMGQLRPMALGNMGLRELWEAVEGGAA